MQGKRDRETVKQGIKLLIAKVILGALAAAAAILLMRLVGRREILVALFIGLVPGIVEGSRKKLVYGVVLGLIGYSVGARVSAAVAKSFIEEVPFGHWAIVGAFIGMTAGISRSPGQWFSFRFVGWSLGAMYGFALGFVFGSLGDIGGFLTFSAQGLGMHFYMREISLLCAGVFINLGAGLAAILAASLDNGLLRVARVIEEAET
jgi:hypothetical protein